MIQYGTEYLKSSLYDILFRIINKDNKVDYIHYDALEHAEFEEVPDFTTGGVKFVPKTLIPASVGKLKETIESQFDGMKALQLYNCAYCYSKGVDLPILDKKAEVTEDAFLILQLQNQSQRTFQLVKDVFPTVQFPFSLPTLINLISQVEEIEQAKVYCNVMQLVYTDEEVELNDKNDIIFTGSGHEILE